MLDVFNVILIVYRQSTNLTNKPGCLASKSVCKGQRKRIPNNCIAIHIRMASARERYGWLKKLLI